jgi:hypothetical protein
MSASGSSIRGARSSIGSATKLSLGPHGLGEIGMEIGAGKRARGCRALLRPGALRESEKSAHNVGLGERGRGQKHGRRSVGVHIALPRPVMAVDLDRLDCTNMVNGNLKL